MAASSRRRRGRRAEGRECEEERARFILRSRTTLCSYLYMPAWVVWAIVAVALAIGEILTPGLFFLGPIALAAVAAAIAAALGAGWVIELVVFVAGRGRVARRPAADRAPHLRMPAARCAPAPPRSSARARSSLERVDARGGRVKIGGEVWSARAFDESQVIEPGTRGPGRRDRGRDRARLRTRRIGMCPLDRRSSSSRCSSSSRSRGRSGSSRRRAPASSSASAATAARSRPGLAIVVPFVDRLRPLIDLREQVVSFHAAAGDHRGQPRRLHRLGHLLPGHRREGGDLRDRELHPGDRAAHRHDAAQRDRRHGAREDAHLARRDQQPAARRARRGDRQVGDPRQPRRAQGDRPAGLDPGVDGEADARRPREARRDPHRRGRASSRRSSPPRARSRRRSSRPRAQRQATILEAEGQAKAIDDRLPGDPRRRRRPEAARLPVPPDAAADRAGRGEQDLDHPERAQQALGRIAGVVPSDTPA